MDANASSGGARRRSRLLLDSFDRGVGSAAIQVGLAAGTRVVATAGGPEKAAVCRELGAHEVIDYGSEDIVSRVREVTGGHGADVVWDPVGGDVFDASRRYRPSSLAPTRTRSGDSAVRSSSTSAGWLTGAG